MAGADLPAFDIGAARDDSVPPQQEHRVRLVIEHVFLKFAHQRALRPSRATSPDRDLSRADPRSCCNIASRTRGGIFWRARRPHFDKFSCAISANQGMRRHVDTTFQEGPKPALTERNSIFSAD